MSLFLVAAVVRIPKYYKHFRDTLVSIPLPIQLPAS